ncbi:MAG: iron-containing alcohol dehydrogenase [Balneolaceae bacterium]|nr:MAG: iron-containing alcohol dehydrogenase [Balneolaceae bacterium]
MNSFEVHIPTHIFFGKEKKAAFFDAVSLRSKQLLLVIGGGSVSKTGYLDEVLAELADRDIKVTLFEGIEPNPVALTIDKAAQLGLEKGVDAVLAFGGGSVMDASKAIAGLIHDRENEIWPFVLGEPRYKTMRGALPVAAIPTTAATASEVTPHAVISNPSVKGKSPVSYPFFKPFASWLNPAFHTSIPAETTRDGASDIFSHVIENYLLGGNDSPLADRYSEGVMETVIETLPLAIAEPGNEAYRGRLLWASTMALNTMQVAGRVPSVFILHNLEHALSGYNHQLAHGRGLAILYPAYFKWLMERDRAVDRLALLGERLFGLDRKNDDETAAEFIAMFEQWLQENGLCHSLTDVDIPEEAFDEIAAYAIRVYGVGKPLNACGEMTASDITEIFRMTLSQGQGEPD